MSAAAIAPRRTVVIAQGNTTLRFDGTLPMTFTPARDGSIAIAQGDVHSTLPTSNPISVGYKGAWPADPPPPPPPPTGIETTFDHLYATGFRLSESRNVRTVPPQTKPAKSADLSHPGYIDANHGTAVFRMTDRSSEASNGGGDHLRHEYSKRNPWNCDNTRYIAQDAQGYWFLYDAATFAKLPRGGFGDSMIGFAGDCEPIWHPTDPHKLWHTAINGGLGWFEYDTEAGTSTQLFTLAGKLPAGFESAARSWFKGEGRPSNDGNRWALMVETDGFAHLGMVMYDRAAGAVIGWLRQSERPDHSMTSPKGNFMLASFGDGPRSYPSTYQGTAKTDGLHLAPTVEHCDVALDANGVEVLVNCDYSSGPLNGYISVVNIATGIGFDVSLAQLYPVSGDATGAHVSGIVSQKRPGWAIVNFETSYSNYGNTRPDPIVRYQYDRVVAIELKPNGRILNIAEHYSSGGSYFNEPQATSNTDGTRIAFASAWNGRDGAATSQSESFMVALPSWGIA